MIYTGQLKPTYRPIETRLVGKQEDLIDDVTLDLARATKAAASA